MVLRDKLNIEEKYIENIKFDEETINEDLEEFNRNIENWDKERIRVQFEDLIRYSYQVLLSKYSLGLSVSDLLKDYKQTVSFMENGWEAESGYVQMVWFLSMGIMFEVEQIEFDKLVTLVERDNARDYLLDLLIQNRNSSWGKQTTKFKFPKPYQALSEVVVLSQTDKQKSIERLQQYLQKEWYKGHSDCGWHNDHKSKWGVHFGYWSFESGAIVKILGLDDSILKDQQYYPYDMVHWKD